MTDSQWSRREPGDPPGSFFSDILTPGSSLNPTFLAILDGAFVILFLVLTTLAYLTAGNPHMFALMGIELGLWASVKWCVSFVMVVAMLTLFTTQQVRQRTQKGAAGSDRKYRRRVEEGLVKRHPYRFLS